MGVLDALRSGAGGNSAVVHECRDCGTTLDDERGVCPTCGSDEIAKYEF